MTLTADECEKIWRASFTNALQLLDEARLLQANKRYARAAALAIYSLEEQTKGITCLSVALGYLKPEALEWKEKNRKVRFLLSHKGKHLIFGFQLASYIAMQEEITKAIQGKSTGTPFDEALLKRFKDTQEFFKTLESQRLSALYVGVEEGEPVSLPSDLFDEQRSASILETASGTIPSWKFILDTPKEIWLPFIINFMAAVKQLG